MFEADGKHLVIGALVVVAPKEHVLNPVDDVLEESSRDILGLMLADPELDLLKKLLDLEDQAYAKGRWAIFYFVEGVGVLSKKIQLLGDPRKHISEKLLG